MKWSHLETTLNKPTSYYCPSVYYTHNARCIATQSLTIYSHLYSHKRQPIHTDQVQFHGERASNDTKMCVYEWKLLIFNWKSNVFHFIIKSLATQSQLHKNDKVHVILRLRIHIIHYDMFGAEQLPEALLTYFYWTHVFSAISFKNTTDLYLSGTAL